MHTYMANHFGCISVLLSFTSILHMQYLEANHNVRLKSFFWISRPRYE